jgi:hypothetical protein
MRSGGNAALVMVVCLVLDAEQDELMADTDARIVDTVRDGQRALSALQACP